MNWGYKILIVYAIFVAGIMFMVFKSANEKFDLVTEDYYAQELKYQNRIEDINRTDKLKSEVICKVEKNKLIIQFPSEFIGKKTTGKLLIYFPADKDKDLQQSFSVSNAHLEQALPANTNGAYTVQINWNCGKQDYYFERKIFRQ